MTDANTTKRLQQELASLMMSGEASISAFPEGDNMFKWRGTIKGADATVYEGLEYKLSIEYPKNYPFTAPTVKFQTPCFHPNVSECGEICLDILKEKWSALYDTRTILLSIQSLLGEPNNNSPLNNQAANMWNDQKEYHRYLHQKYKEDSGKAIKSS